MEITKPVKGVLDKLLGNKRAKKGKKKKNFMEHQLIKVIPDFDIEKYAFGDIDYFKHLEERLTDDKIVKL